MEIVKNEKDKLLLGILGLVTLIFLGSFLIYDNKFWFGLAGALSLPFVFVAFLLDAYESEFG